MENRRVYEVCIRDKREGHTRSFIPIFTTRDITEAVRYILHAKDDNQYSIGLFLKNYACNAINCFIIDDDVVKLREDPCFTCTELWRTCFKSIVEGITILSPEEVKEKERNIKEGPLSESEKRIKLKELRIE